MALINFVDSTTVIMSAWLNKVDVLLDTVFGAATTALAARTALGLTVGSSNVVIASAGVQPSDVVITHGLGTDNIDFGYSFVHSVAGNEAVTDVIVRGFSNGVIWNVSGIYIGAINLPALPSAGTLKIACKSATAGTVTIYWWARKRA